MKPEDKVLTLDTKLNVQYCIALWLRDEQMALNITKVKARLQPSPVLHKESVAVVCFGPSLKDTWEQLKNYKTIITCSGAHKFLIERGIVPTYHVEVDPRKHKITLMGEPHKDVQYLIASCCHPDLIEYLLPYNLKLWHVFANGENGKTFPEIFPRGEWAITGGSSVGLRAMTIARLLGYKNQHVFGMDGSFPQGEERHASKHPNRPPVDFTTEYKGITYFTTPSFLECAKQTFHELDMMIDVNATFFGEGLVQAMAQDYKLKPPPKGTKNLIAFNIPEVISEEYAELNKRLHRENLAYGVGGGKHVKTVTNLAKSMNTTSVLDYGCGKGYLAKELPFPIWEYDPGVPGKESTPKSADLVVCTDVLEHIEPEKLMFVLDDLARCVKKMGYFVIHTGPSTKTLADGRNSHLIQKDYNWWKGKLEKFFTLQENSIMERKPLLYVVVTPKNKREKVMEKIKVSHQEEIANN